MRWKDGDQYPQASLNETEWMWGEVYMRDLMVVRGCVGIKVTQPEVRGGAAINMMKRERGFTASTL